MLLTSVGDREAKDMIVPSGFRRKIIETLQGDGKYADISKHDSAPYGHFIFNGETYYLYHSFILEGDMNRGRCWSFRWIDRQRKLRDEPWTSSKADWEWLFSTYEVGGESAPNESN